VRLRGDAGQVGRGWRVPERRGGGRRVLGRRCGREGKRKGEGGTDRWAAAQCQAMVPLTGGFDLSADGGQSGARRADARGLAREGTEVGRLDE
jgi:hypothetical protein